MRRDKPESFSRKTWTLGAVSAAGNHATFPGQPGVLVFPEGQAEPLFSFQSSPSVPLHLFRNLLFSFPGNCFPLSWAAFKKRKVIFRPCHNPHTQSTAFLCLSFFFLSAGSPGIGVSFLPFLPGLWGFRWPRVDTEETFLKICSHPSMKGRMKTVHQGLPAIGWKACSFTCFKSAVFVPDSKARDRMTLAGLCYKHAHRHVCFIETSLFPLETEMPFFFSWESTDSKTRFPKAGELLAPRLWEVWH